MKNNSRKTTILFVNRVLSIILCLALVISVFGSISIVSAARLKTSQAEISSGLTYKCSWTLDDNGTLIISGDGAMGNYYIEYQDYAPFKSLSIKKVIIEDGVTNIGNGAFCGCKNLESIIIPNSVTSIGDYAFDGCAKLPKITIPDSVEIIGRGAFSGCTSLAEIGISDSVKEIKDRAFHNTAWYNNQSDGMVYLDKIAYDFKLQNLADCPENLSIKDGTVLIAEEAISDCYKLKSISIPNTVRAIGSNAFSGCTGLTDVIIPDSVTSIGDSAFYACSFTDIIIPKSVTKIGAGIFSSCEELKTIIVSNENTVYDSRNDCNAIIETESNTLITGCKYTTIPTSVTIIGNGAFSGCFIPKDFTISDSVKTIGNYAFSECSGLNSITIPNSVTNIGEGAFYNCTSLSNIYISDSVTHIGRMALYNTAWYNTLSNIYNDRYIYVGKVLYECKDYYSESVSIKNDTVGIADEAFSQCRYLTSIAIPNSVKSIGKRAFEYCGELSNISIPNSVEYIGESAFSYCGELYNISIPDSVKYIGEDAFNGTIWYNSQPDGLVMAGNIAYKYKNTSICPESITIKDGTLSITDNTFMDCSNLKTITIPKSVKNIGYRAFGYKWYDDGGQTIYSEKIDGFTVYGYSGTVAEKYAKVNGFLFVSLDEEKLIGDTNCDGHITVSDVTAIQRHIAELEVFTDEQLALADTNGDGSIDITDATHLQKYLAEFDGVVLGKS